MPAARTKKKTSEPSAVQTLDSPLFKSAINRSLIHQAVRTQMHNSRQGTQSTKTRSEVSHTTRKPYKQKGTGRARQGMLSAPHFRHGGVAMGPRPRAFHISLPKKMRRAAILSALSSKSADQAIVVMESLGIDTISTKSAASLLSGWELTGKRVLIVLPEHNLVIYKSFRNIPGVEVRVAPAFSTRDVVNAQRIVFAGNALQKIEAVWGSPLQPAKAEEA